ncbi:TetR/AcrR family transcriptional regulator [Altererythrobacter lutimaris]|uniref:TetR/AcrR family transcriptional regulator n=1 Tax=Altererythrobacter lutimaris TaxID=2743979 RepID=A0A850HA45_9SPHN|nr:TetR/AcrR family transcriptional regulator [Altererythrobacter lutimaris]NVE94823.1 TetR/AcrR family transcriptional regulator [Altererythrobacter lutimaris]
MSSKKNPGTRSRILEAAWKALESGDPRQSRMGDIAKAAGISRQALYLHFPSRTELLVATARHLDEVFDVDAALAESRAAKTGRERLPAFIRAWSGHIPHIYGVGRAFMAMMPSDEAAESAWRDRMKAVRHGCEAAVEALKKEGALAPRWDQKKAVDWLWTLLSVRNWEHLTQDCGWSQSEYLDAMVRTAEQTLLRSTN